MTSEQSGEELERSLPEDHPWARASSFDRDAQRCPNCEVTVPLTAADIQAGIQLYCPECFDAMEWCHVG